MKTIKKLLFVAFAAMTISACQEELENPNGGVQGSDKVVTFTGSLDQIETKTTIWYESDMEDGKIETRFMNGDHIMVNGIESGQIDKVNSSGTQISFSVQGVEEGPYYAMTAAQVTTKEVEETSVPVYDATSHAYGVTIAGTQKYRKVDDKKQTSHDSGAHILAAYSDNESMQFKHMTTFLAISIDAESSSVADNTKTVYVRQGDGGNIAGSWSLKFDADNEPYMEPSASLSSAITYNCVVKDVSDDGVPQGSVMIIGVPSYDYANGLLVTIEDMDGRFASFKISAEKTAFASQGGVIVPFNPSFNPESRRTIKTADDWNEFAAHINATKGNAYQWVGGGSVMLENNIEAENLTPITAEFKYVFDGNDKTITQNNATKPLFSNLSGEIKNLTLAGKLDLGSASGAPLVNKLAVGGKISGCTNNMSVVCKRTGHTYVSGLVEYMEGGVIEGCTNNGTVDVEVGEGSSLYNVAVAGVVADIRITDGGAVVLKNCTNSETASLTLKSEIKSKITQQSNLNRGMQSCGFGGIAGWLRNAASYTFTNCDNQGSITFDASLITQANGGAAKVVAVGGVLGLAAPNSNGLMIADFSNQYNVSLTDCDNTGLVYNQGVNYSATQESKNKVFTGGLAGALGGTKDDHAEVISCTNTGMILTHDYTSGTQDVTPSGRTAYCPVAGGLVGYGVYLDIDRANVQCQIGNGKRHMAAWGGVIGYALRQFSLKNSTVDVSGYFARYSGYSGNRAAIAVVPVWCTDRGAMDVVPDVEGSEISNNNIKCLLYTSATTASATSTADLSESLTKNTFSTADLVKANLVCGEGYTTASTDITIGDDNTYTAATPAN